MMENNCNIFFEQEIKKRMSQMSKLTILRLMITIE